MESYQIVEPANYHEICELGNVVSRAILDRKVPEPVYISKVLGEDAVSAYYLMHALLHSIEYGRGRGVVEPARRDGKAVQIHSYEGAFKPYYRLLDDKLPSNYILTPREIRGVLVHDLGEEFGQSLLGALVVNDAVSYLIGEDTGKDADLLTNKSSLLLEPLESLIKRFKIIDENNVYRVLNRSISDVEVPADSIQKQYQRVLNALLKFENYVRREVDYIPSAQTNDLLERIGDMFNKLSKKMDDGGILNPSETEERVKEQYRRIMKVIEDRDYFEVDKRLVVPGSPEFLLTLKKTLYRDFIRGIARDVASNVPSVSQNGYPKEHGYLAPIMERLSESTNTVANMERTPLTNATSIFRKARITLRVAGIELSEHLKTQEGQEIAYQRLQNGVKYLLENLDIVVDRHYANLEGLVRLDTNWRPDFETFRIMAEGMQELKDVIFGTKKEGLEEGKIEELDRIVRCTI